MSKNKFFDQFLEDIKKVHELKEKDYTGENDPFFNFDFSQNFASRFNSRADKPYAYLIGTKIARLISLLNQELARPRNEPIEDRFKDIAVYFLLWASKRKDLEPQEEPFVLKPEDSFVETKKIPITQQPFKYLCPDCKGPFDTLKELELHICSQNRKSLSSAKEVFGE